MYQEVSKQFNITSLLFVLHLYYVFSFHWWWSIFVCYLCLTWLFATCTTVQNVKEAFPKEIKISLMTCYIESFATWMEISLHEDSPTKMTSWWLSDYYNLTLKVKGKKTCVLEYLFLEIFVYLCCESLKFKIYVTCILIYVVSQLQRNEVMWYVVFYWWIQFLIKLRAPGNC